MIDQIRTGDPVVEARYVAFIRCEASQGKAWVEPIIMVWATGRWHSSFIPQRRVLGWIGPLPVLKVADISEQVFDL